MEKDKIKELLNNTDDFLELTDNTTAEQWHNEINYHLGKIKNHEIGLKHAVRLYGMKKKSEILKIWVCEDCNKIFCKVKFNPESLHIKEIFQMCYHGGLSDLAENKLIHIKKLTNHN